MRSTSPSPASVGELTVGHPVFGHVDGHPELYSVSKHRKANRFEGRALLRPWSGWHTDVTAAVNPPAASILRGVVIPPYGGDTQWTNLAAAYQGAVRAAARHRRRPARRAPLHRARRRQRHRRLRPGRQGAHPGQRASAGARASRDRRARALHQPVLPAAPERLPPRESQQLLELLWEHAVRPEFTVRFQWEPGSLAFWDNRATAHPAPADIFDLDFDRQLYRTTLVGDVPVGVDGRPRWRWKATRCWRRTVPPRSRPARYAASGGSPAR